MKDPTAMPMMVPVDSCVWLEGWSWFGDRVARLGELAAGPGELVLVVKSNSMVFEVVVVTGRDSEDVVTVCCAAVVFGPNAELIAISRLYYLNCGQSGLFERLEVLRIVMSQQ